MLSYFTAKTRLSPFQKFTQLLTRCKRVKFWWSKPPNFLIEIEKAFFLREGDDLTAVKIG